VAEPLAEIVAVVNWDHWAAGRLSESFNELLVLGIITVLGENDEIGNLLVDGLADLVETLDEA